MKDTKSDTDRLVSCDYYQALTPTQRLLVDRMRQGHVLMWCGDAGPELQGYPLWPRKSTVRALINKGVLKWGEPNNKSQSQAGIIPVVLA